MDDTFRIRAEAAAAALRQFFPEGTPDPTVQVGVWPHTAVADAVWLVSHKGSRYEKNWYSIIDDILRTLFPSSLGFSITPQAPPEVSSRKSIDFMAFHIVWSNGQWDRLPVLIWEAKPSGLGGFDKQDADRQMRERYLGYQEGYALPVLFGISSIGPWLQAYVVFNSNKTIWPPRPADADAQHVTQWPNYWHRHNMFRESGATLLHQIADQIKEMVQHVRGSENLTPSPEQKQVAIENLENALNSGEWD
ncbi:hypothetical protein CALCODRAFT_488936 [Calocera cornea HHB12733]|uniref:Uncharacterized protein n=1 Tax=Calocera cornea HHB12733 TaxID=1353952 RepID=A0A165C238_9BASI|nr:hypothetical protein CALCODRAFT_488936 [Calocera cornea HHB12733]